MRRWIILGLTAALVLAPAAYADIYVIVANTTVHRGGYLRGTGDGSRMPFYLVAKPLAPVDGDRLNHPPRRPYVFLGRLRRTRNPYATQHFRFRVPKVRPGKYKVVIWCRPCGGTLILAGPTGFGQTVTVLP
jgi:hypothetical protein